MMCDQSIDMQHVHVLHEYCNYTCIHHIYTVYKYRLWMREKMDVIPGAFANIDLLLPQHLWLLRPGLRAKQRGALVLRRGAGLRRRLRLPLPAGTWQAHRSAGTVGDLGWKWLWMLGMIKI